MLSFAHLLKTDVEARDQVWETAFLSALPQAPVRVLSPDPQEGPDHWPYLLVEAGQPEAGQPGEDDSIHNIVGWLSSKGIGLVVNPTQASPDFVLTYGMIWNYRERGEFLTTPVFKDKAPKAGLFEVKNGQQLWVGSPTQAYLPAYVRQVLKQFLADQGIFAPKVALVSADNQDFDLCFSIESLKSPPTREHSNIAEALSWFLPAHYTIALLSEKSVSGFAAL